MANIVDPDETTCYKLSHLDLHCLYMCLFWSSELKRLREQDMPGRFLPSFVYKGDNLCDWFALLLLKSDYSKRKEFASPFRVDPLWKGNKNFDWIASRKNAFIPH